MTYQSYTDSVNKLTYGYGRFSNPTPTTSNSRLVIGSWTDSIITLTGNTLVIPQGYQVQLIASFYLERSSGLQGSNFLNMQWYDETNTAYIGTQATMNCQWPIASPPNNICNAALAMVDTSSGSITVSCKISSYSASVSVNVDGSRFTIYGSQSWLTAITAPV